MGEEHANTRALVALYASADRGTGKTWRAFQGVDVWVLSSGKAHGLEGKGEGEGLTSLLHFIRDDAADEVGTCTHQGGHQLIKLLLWS